MTNKTAKFSTLFVCATIVTVSSCSSGYSYRRPESVKDKIDRYQSRNKNANQVPEVNIEEFAYDKGHKRGPASVESSSNKDDGLNQYNNKRLYFLTLLSQYRELGKYSSAKRIKALNHCPNFHTSFLNYKESHPISDQTVGYKLPIKDLSILKDSKSVTKYPEFFLPMTNHTLRPRVIDILSSEEMTIAKAQTTVQKAIDIHVSKTHSELNELCDTGSSSNYYIYENLITHIKTRNKLKANKDGMKTLFKTTLFSNMAIEKSMKKNQKKKSRSIASFVKKQSYGSEVIKRLEVPWAENYFK
jgi:hypothetical protein